MRILEIAWVEGGAANSPPPLPPPRSSPSAPEPRVQSRRRAVALDARACLREAEAASRRCVTEAIASAVAADVALELLDGELLLVDDGLDQIADGHDAHQTSEERRGGKEGFRKCRTRW